MGKIYTLNAPVWLAVMAGIAFCIVPPLSFAQSGPHARGAMASTTQAPPSAGAKAQGQAETEPGKGASASRPCGERSDAKTSAHDAAKHSSDKADESCDDTQASSVNEGKPPSVGSPDQNGLPGSGASAGAGGSIDERSR